MRIYITGFMGAGKTTVGRHLAARLGRSFIDLDEEIERQAGMTIRDIFARRGEARFRSLEGTALRETSRLTDVLVATGGGTVTVAGNMEFIRRSGLSLWLNPSFDTILSRMGGWEKEDRPLFRTDEEALQLYRRRLVAYRKCDLRVDVEPDEKPQQVAGRIEMLLSERKGALPHPL